MKCGYFYFTKGQKYSDEDSHFPTTDTNSRVKDYSRGGTKFRQVSKTTLPRPPMPCPDFVIGWEKINITLHIRLWTQYFTTFMISRRCDRG